MQPTWRNTALALFTACLLLGGIFGNRVLALTDQTREVLQTYTQLVSLAHENYGQEVSYRNLVSASIPIALADALDSGALSRGDKILVSGFGVGLSWGTALIEI